MSPTELADAPALNPVELVTPAEDTSRADLPRLLGLLAEYTRKLRDLYEEARRSAGWSGIQPASGARAVALLPPAVTLANYASQRYAAWALDSLSVVELELRMAEIEAEIVQLARLVGYDLSVPHRPRRR